MSMGFGDDSGFDYYVGCLTIAAELRSKKEECDRLRKRVEDLEDQLDELRVTNKRLEFDLFSEMARNGRLTRRIDGLLRKIGEKAEGQASD